MDQGQRDRGFGPLRQYGGGEIGQGPDGIEEVLAESLANEFDRRRVLGGEFPPQSLESKDK